MRIVKEVTYRKIAAYVKVVGRTPRGAERHFRSVGSALLKDLPQEAVRPGRYRGLDAEGFHFYEIPVLLNGPNTRTVLAKLMLKGGP